ncbi:MAG: FAD synthetase family protein [Treponema sp.]|nr:FAD synthetase family protein [Treponema sp.]
MQMQIIEWQEFLLNPLPLNGKSSAAITVGVFDGVHRGHQALIRQVVERADDSVPVVVTFKHSGFKKSGANGHGAYQGNIVSFRQKMALFEHLGIAVTVVIEFCDSFSRTSGDDFLRILHEQGKMSFLTVGSNFRCGYQLDTDARAIQAFTSSRGIPAVIMPILAEGAVQISSSHIRAAIARGELQTAEAMLGYPFTVDLSGGATVADAGGAFVYSIASRGCILPPPGTYAVNLLGEQSGTSVKIEVCVDKGNIILAKNALPENVCFEYAEFREKTS